MTDDELHLLANAAHEIRNSLTTLGGATQVLLRRLEAAEADQDTIRLARMAVRRASVVRQLADEVLDWRRASTGRIVVDLEPTDAAHLTREVIEGTSLAVDSHPLTFDGPEPAWAHADPRRLEQILNNLLDNALKYCPAGTRIDARARQHDSEVRIEVRDRGPGMSTAVRARIFEPYYQADRGSPGLGLGLPLSRRMATRMGGRLWHEAPEDGIGSRFCLALRRYDPPEGER